MKKNKTVLGCVLEFKKRYPITVMWRIKKHCQVIEKHLNCSEKVLYAFAAQKNNNPLDVITSYVKNIIIPTVILAGEKDIVSYEHTKLIADNIKNSVLEIIPKENHGSYIIHSDKLYGIIEKYL